MITATETYLPINENSANGSITEITPRRLPDYIKYAVNIPDSSEPIVARAAVGKEEGGKIGLTVNLAIPSNAEKSPDHIVEIANIAAGLVGVEIVKELDMMSIETVNLSMKISGAFLREESLDDIPLRRLVDILSGKMSFDMFCTESEYQGNGAIAQLKFGKLRSFNYLTQDAGLQNGEPIERKIQNIPSNIWGTEINGSSNAVMHDRDDEKRNLDKPQTIVAADIATKNKVSVPADAVKTSTITVKKSRTNANSAAQTNLDHEELMRRLAEYEIEESIRKFVTVTPISFNQGKLGIGKTVYNPIVIPSVDRRRQIGKGYPYLADVFFNEEKNSWQVLIRVTGSPKDQEKIQNQNSREITSKLEFAKRCQGYASSAEISEIREHVSPLEIANSTYPTIDGSGGFIIGQRSFPHRISKSGEKFIPVMIEPMKNEGDEDLHERQHGIQIRYYPTDNRPVPIAVERWHELGDSVVNEQLQGSKLLKIVDSHGEDTLEERSNSALNDLEMALKEAANLSFFESTPISLDDIFLTNWPIGSNYLRELRKAALNEEQMVDFAKRSMTDVEAALRSVTKFNPINASQAAVLYTRSFMLTALQSVCANEEILSDLSVGHTAIEKLRKQYDRLPIAAWKTAAIGKTIPILQALNRLAFPQYDLE